MRRAALLLTAAVPLSRASDRPLVGINYFAGWWTGPGDKWKEPWNTSVDWRPLYPERVPALGEYNAQGTMDQEIDAASSHGVDYFQILWYNNHPTEPAPGARFLNRGVQQFMNSSNAGKMKFFIEWCNALPLFGVHSDDEWELMIKQDWLPALRHPSYLRVGGQLVFKVHSGPAFKQNCTGSDAVVTQRLDLFRELVREAGLGELLLGVGSGAKDISNPAAWWGYPYNFTNIYGHVAQDDVSYMGDVFPWANESAFVREWRTKHADAADSGHGGHPYAFVPSVMSGWDPRPWRERRASYVFPTHDEWVAELEAVREDLRSRPTMGFPLPGGGRAPAFSIYAWNEFGEGGIMAPSAGWGTARLDAVASVFPPAAERA